MKKILITGGMGFIGSNLVKRLLKNPNYHITVIDNLCSSKEKVFDHSNKSNFEFIEGDIINIKDYKYDFIFNLACPASPPNYQRDHLHTFETSVIGFSNILESSKKYNTPIFHCSTSEIYGDPLVHPQGEDYFGNVNTFGSRSCYDVGKRATETLSYIYKNFYQSKIAITRIFNTYGPNMDVNDGRVVSNFICQALQNKDITIYGDGSQTRSLCYVDDILDVFIMSMERDIYPDKPFNLGNNHETSIRDICDIIINLTNSKSKIVFNPLPEDDPKKRNPKLNNVKKYFGWEPTTNLKNGLTKTIEYFNSELSR